MAFFITVEGGEFAGKTSVVLPGLADVFRHSGIDVVTSREPGGTPQAEQIRKKIIARVNAGAPGLELALLFNQARKLHLDQVIKPFLHEHSTGIVLSDRYADTMMVLQGMDAGVPLDNLFELHKKYTGNFFPDHTLILYFPESIFKEIFNKRKAYADLKTSEGGRDKMKWDSRPIDEQLVVQRYYLSLPQLYIDHGITRSFDTVNASLHPYEVIKESVVSMQKFYDRKDMKIDLISSFNQILQSGKWSQLDVAWQSQQTMQ